MTKEKKQQAQEPEINTAAAAENAAETKQAEPAASQPEQKPETNPVQAELERTKAELTKEHDNYLRLAAEYDNFRKRTQKEKDSLYTDITADTVSRFLPVYDNLERAFNQITADEAYKKGVEMTMAGLLKVMEELGVVPFGEKGDAFNPAMHNAVMHEENADLGENVLSEVFQKGFRVGDKVVRFAMVKVAN